jgi:hypothetical protein
MNDRALEVPLETRMTFIVSPPEALGIVILHSPVIGKLIAGLSHLKAIHMRASRLAALQTGVP